MRRWMGLLLLVVVFAPTAAQAHDVVVKTDPANNARVASLPAKVTVTFEEPPKQADAVLTTPEGRVRPLTATIRETELTAPLPHSGPRGDYVVAYRVVSDDGHPVEGSITFTVKSGPQPTFAGPRGSTPTVTGQGFPLLGLAGGLGALLVVGIVILVARSSKR